MIWYFWPRKNLSSGFPVPGVVHHTQKSNAWDCTYNQKDEKCNLDLFRQKWEKFKIECSFAISKVKGQNFSQSRKFSKDKD